MFNHPFSGVRLAVVVSFFAFALSCLLPTNTVIHLMEEGQLVETLTLYAYAIVLLYFIFRPNLHITVITRCSIIFCLFVMMAREADLHKSIAHMSMLKLRFWTGNLPLHDKMVALLILLPVVVACLFLLIKHAKNIWLQAKLHKAYAVTTVTFVVLIPLTNIADRSLGLLNESFRWHAPLWLVAFQSSQEELLEMSLPLLALLAIIQYKRSKDMGDIVQVYT
ncbi:hypothetical protein JK232_17775 [Nissabacter archeti]|uniref:Uncharacterized protein n=1 Tax=Nissabacter archeti TaxID=1917880 RepID=A0ABS5JND8_9GAMM|nr:hypothetical protein [Nissabacter archeti]MBS0970743.1 hypothetical protein [Nissabacter archeti]